MPSRCARSFDLRGRLLAADVHHLALAREPCRNLQQQRRFSGARRSADERQAARERRRRRAPHRTPASPRCSRMRRSPVDLAQRDRLGARRTSAARGARAFAPRTAARSNEFQALHDGQRPSQRARFEPARRTKVHRARFGHAAVVSPPRARRLPGERRRRRHDTRGSLRKAAAVAFAQPMQIAIDGPAASGKTTVAQLLAGRLGSDFVDTGAMYRALAYEALRSGVDPGKRARWRCAPTRSNAAVTETFPERTLQSETVTAIVSTVAAHPEVREAMVEAQRRVAEGRPVVMAGRDIGTVVLPHAAVKIYLTASVAARVERRRAQLEKAGDRSRRAAPARRDRGARPSRTARARSLRSSRRATRIELIPATLAVTGVVDAILDIVAARRRRDESTHLRYRVGHCCG